ncbi:unnamed protein product [Schistosoma curassoni]|uniref:TGS domain-containing protein n=1 Tax=Schistosoma curassoni TaxID=6186 RepID=A0A183KJJ8_9TREM|nr:unnamed protein product [Schistosoma curassoni]
MKKLTEKYGKPERRVKDKKGRTITEIQEPRIGWPEHFEELINRLAPLDPTDIEIPHTDLPIDIIAPTTVEIRVATGQIKCGKAKGPDNISAEALKSDIEVTASMLHVPFRKIWEEKQLLIH